MSGTGVVGVFVGWDVGKFVGLKVGFSWVIDTMIRSVSDNNSGKTLLYSHPDRYQLSNLTDGVGSFVGAGVACECRPREANHE